MTGLTRYNVRKKRVDERPANPGKEITDHLPFVGIDPETLDLYSEINPLDELIGKMADKTTLVLETEIPKWRKRGQLRGYGWGVAKGILKMDLMQGFMDRFVAGKKEENLTVLKREIKAFAAGLGYISGFTKIDRRFIAEGRNDKFPYDTALVLGMEMDKKLLDEAPRPGKKLFDFEIYVKSGREIFKVAKFIRARGYKCRVRVPFDGWVKYPPHAITAGLGELGAQGVVITREFGPRLRWGMISIDADIEIDAPVDLNMAAYCDACRKCIRACPGKAVSNERVWWRGVYKRKINDVKCWPYFTKFEGCGICLKVCPINRYGYEECMTAFLKDGSIPGHRNNQLDE